MNNFLIVKLKLVLKAISMRISMENIAVKRKKKKSMLVMVNYVMEVNSSSTPNVARMMLIPSVDTSNVGIMNQVITEDYFQMKFG